MNKKQELGILQTLYELFQLEINGFAVLLEIYNIHIMLANILRMVLMTLS